MTVFDRLYFLRLKKVGTLDWARPFPADASSTSRANEGPASSALPWPMAYRPWALAELTRRRPFFDTRKGACGGAGGAMAPGVLFRRFFGIYPKSTLADIEFFWVFLEFFVQNA